MKYITFERQINELKRFYAEACERDLKLQEALGGDTQIMTDWWSSILDNTLDILREEFSLSKDDDTLDWLFYDCICGNGDVYFKHDGINYIGNTKNIYLSLTGMLDERLGEVQELQEDYEEQEIKNHLVEEVEEVEDFVSDLILTKTEVKSDPNSFKIAKDEEVNTNITNINSDEKIVNGSPLLLKLKDYQIKLESVELAEKLDKAIKEKFMEDGEWKYPTEEEYYNVLKNEFSALMIDSKNLPKRDRITNHIINVLGHLGSESMSRSSLEMAEMEITILLNRSKEYKEISTYKVEISEATSSIYGSLQWEDEKPKDFRVSFKSDKAMVEWI